MSPSSPTIRPLHKRDMAAAEHLWARSYLVDSAVARAGMMGRVKRAFCRGVFVGGRMAAAGRLLPLRATLGGRQVGLGGIAGLATNPEDRRRGHIQHLLLAILGEMRERGMVLSALYPFDSAFYRRYGWALADATTTVRLPTAALVQRERSSGRIVEVDPGEMASLIDLHAAAGDRHNLTVVRDSWWFHRYVALVDNLTVEPRLIYRYQPPRGTGGGYVVVHYRRSVAGGPVVMVRELVAADAAARRALLAFVGDLDSQAPLAEFVVPDDDPLRAELVAYDDVDVAAPRELLAMVRIVDLAGLVDGALVGGGDGDLIVEVDDDYARWNRGRWRMTVAAGTASWRRTRKEPDCRLAIHTAAQLVSGFVSAASAIAAGLVSGRRPEAISLLAGLAGGRRPFHNEYY
jgi:predicted acetyltransferase